MKPTSQNIISVSLLPVLLLFLLASCALLSYIDVLSPINTTPLTTQFQILKNVPFSLLSHIKLAQIYHQLRRQQDAYLEIQLAQESEEYIEVLGETSDSKEIANKITSEPELIEKQLAFWISITQQYPKYLDAWLQLWFLNYNHNHPTKVFREKVLQIDPNYLIKMPEALRL